VVDRRLSWLDLGARPALFPALSFALGALLGPQPTASPFLFLGAACLAGLGSLVLNGRTGAHLLLLFGFGLGGIGLSTLAARVTVPPRALEQRLVAMVEGEVLEVSVFEGGTRVDVAVSWVEGHAGPVRFGARLYARGEANGLFAGQRIRVPVSLRPQEPPLNPGQPDFRGRHLRRGLVLTGGFDPRRLVPLSPPPSHRPWLQGVHAALAQRVRQLSPTPEAAALYLTLAAGLRAELGDELEERFSASGLAHVLSVSGLHVAILALLLLRGLRLSLVRVRPLARRCDVRRLAAPLAVPLVWGYVAFTGNQAPAVRSAVMATAVLLGMALWRRADGLNGLALAALALLAVDPAAVADLSTQLSFLAVGSLLVVGPAVRQALPFPPPEPGGRGWRRRLLRARESILSTFAASVAVTLAASPLIAHVFQRLSLAGLVSNVVCLPLCGVLTVLAAGGAGLFLLHPVLAEPLLFAGGWAAQGLLWAASFFAQLPGASLRVSSFGTLAGVTFVTGLFGWALLRGRARQLGWVAPLALVLATAIPRALPEPGLSVTFLGVGHGDAIVLSSRGRHALVDAGGAPGGADTGRRYVLPYLRHRRIEALELAVLSHPHADHALGMIATLDAVPAARLWHAAGEADAPLTRQVRSAAGKARVEEVEADHPTFVLGEAEIDVLWPPSDRLLLAGVNDRSVVLRVTHGQVTFLLTGDIEADAEEGLPDLGAYTVVKAPHHGSRTSSTAAFVSRVRPRVVVFCVGRLHRWGFPADEVVARYRQVGSACYRTDLHGAVRVESDGHSVRVKTFLPTDGQAAGPTVAAAQDRPHPLTDDP
jgi:competence protein ComEC